MSQHQQDHYKAILGDEKARVSVGRDLSEKDYGNGGGVMVNVTLTCGQSQPEISQAIALAHDLANGAARHYHNQLRQQLVSQGVIK